jgi:coenzyme F420-reducing hydrogenase alpha subunit
LNLNRDRLFPIARQLADDVCPQWPMLNPFHSIIARGLEVVHALEEAIKIIESYQSPKPAFVPYQHRAGWGCAATEAPRGLLYHAYRMDEAGQVSAAKIVPPTSQNQRQIEADLYELLPGILSDDEDQTAAGCEKLIRTYDPCISCSTHFLRLTLERT